MLRVEQTGSDRAMSIFHTEEQNSASKMDLGKLDSQAPPNCQQRQVEKIALYTC